MNDKVKFPVGILNRETVLAAQALLSFAPIGKNHI